jgi:hypothetical protein
VRLIVCSAALWLLAGCSTLQGDSRSELRVCQRNFGDRYAYVELEKADMTSLLQSIKVSAPNGVSISPQPGVFSYWLFRSSSTQAVLCEVERGRASAYRTGCWPGGWQLELGAAGWEAISPGGGMICLVQ